MCGILGITEKNEDLVRTAAKTFAYRGPDAQVAVADGSVTLGHNRLSIIDLDARANQPMVRGALRIVFNGEIYNYKELKRELEGLGASFRTESDTEVLLAAYEQWGSEMTKRLRGMYALAIHDSRANTLVLATDYSGMKPIFYARIGDSFAFASELKGVLSMKRQKGEVPAIDHESLGLYWALGYVPVPKTIYEGVHRLPRRTILTLDLSSGEATEFSYDLPASAAKDTRDMEALIEQSVQRHLVADVPVGIFFSGGTDSSLIAAILKKQGVALEAFSLEVEARPDDKKYFEKIADYLQLHLHQYRFTPESFDGIYNEVSALIDEPLQDSSLYPTYFIAHEAAKKVKVVLSGDGGDEYFLGYPQTVVLSRMHDAAIDGGMSLLDYVWVLTPRFRGKVLLFARLFELLRRPISYYLLAVSPAKDFLSVHVWKTAKRTLAARSMKAIELDADHYLENDILRKADLATMYNSLEGRIPLLDPDILASATFLMKERVPLKEKKPVLKEILARYLPKELVYRGKRGFGLDASIFFAQSKYLKKDLGSALAYLEERGLLPPRRFMPLEALIARRSQLCWQILSLYHALKNAGI